MAPESPSRIVIMKNWHQSCFAANSFVRPRQSHSFVLVGLNEACHHGISDYEAKAVTLAGRRYIVCRNHQEAQLAVMVLGNHHTAAKRR